MDKLSNYDEATKNHIIHIGIQNYLLNKHFFESKSAKVEDIDAITEKNALNKEIETLKKSKNELLLKLDEQSKKLVTIREDMYENTEEKIKNVVKTKENEIIYFKKQYETLKNGMFNEINVRADEKNKINHEKILIMDQKIKMLTDTIEEKEQKIIELNKKYVHATKGSEFEKSIFENLENIIETHYDSVWSTRHVGPQMGGKGDIILCHKITDFCVMIDPKNHDCVTKAHKDKFLKDMRDPLNSFDCGLMVSRGKIRGMRSYEEIEEGTKKLLYLSNYVVGQEDFLLNMIEKVHNEFYGKQKDVLDLKNIRPKYISEYKRLSRQKALNDENGKLLNERIKEITTEYYDYYKADIQTDSVGKKVSSGKIEKSDHVNNFLDSFLIPDEKSKIKISEIYVDYCKKFPDTEKKQFTKCLNVWKKMKSGVESKLKSTSYLKGYKSKNTISIATSILNAK